MSGLVVGKKLTTRPRRSMTADTDHVFVDEIPENYGSYAYQDVGASYALNVAEIEAALGLAQSYIVSCTYPQLFPRLRTRYELIAIYVYRSLDTVRIAQLMTERGDVDPDSTRRRIDEVGGGLRRYAENIGCYDHVLINAGSKTQLARQLLRLFRIYGIRLAKNVGAT
jgi:hypothetical protein